MSTAQAIVRQDGDGEQLWFAGGGVFTIKASAEETRGAFVLFEDRVVRGKTTPMHLHPDEDETIYILEGELLVDMDGEQHRVGRNGVFVAPRGVPHAFLVTSETARLLCLQTPGSGESFYRDASDPVSSDSRRDEAAGPRAAARRSGASDDDPAARTATVHRRPIRARPDTRRRGDGDVTPRSRRCRACPEPSRAPGSVSARRTRQPASSTTSRAIRLPTAPACATTGGAPFELTVGHVARTRPRLGGSPGRATPPQRTRREIL